MSQNRPASVTALLNYLKGKLETDSLLQKVLVTGEISNFSSYRSGHWYFSLKDANAQIRCVMFASQNRRVTFSPKDGDRVIVQADVSVYTGRGDLQLLIAAMKPDGIGDLYLQYEALKKKLEAEGLFDAAHKKPVPSYPFSIALVTGKNTAARSDVLTTLARRWPCASVSEFPVLVQGRESAGQICDALRKADGMGFDVILLVRGGGSIEDLWSFNDEQLARVIYSLDTPLVTGVGHETDFTIADFVSDLRAPTPTGAAERCSPDIREVSAKIERYQSALITGMHDTLDYEQERLDRLSSNRYLLEPYRLVSDRSMRLHTLTLRLNRKIDIQKNTLHQKIVNYQNDLSQSAEKRIDLYQRDISSQRTALVSSLSETLRTKTAELAKNSALLDAYSPLKVLGRGYSITVKDKKAVHSASALKKGDMISIRFSEGRAEAEVKKIYEEVVQDEK